MKTISPKEICKIDMGEMIAIQNLSMNQIILHTDSGSIFFSYGKIIGQYIKGQLYLTPLHDYSKTTSKYCTKWCGHTTKERKEGLEKELYILISE